MDNIPSESTFSPAFAEFAISELGTQAHDCLVQEYLADELLGHISRDFTAIVGREKPAKKVKVPKKNAKGYKTSWNGYKLHLDINDTGFPISALVTSASLHDSQVAIPLIKQTSSKVNYLYDLMDAAYEAKRINETSRQFGHVPIIDKNALGKEVTPMAAHETERYKTRGHLLNGLTAA